MAWVQTHIPKKDNIRFATVLCVESFVSWEVSSFFFFEWKMTSNNKSNIIINFVVVSAPSWVFLNTSEAIEELLILFFMAT